MAKIKNVAAPEPSQAVSILALGRYLGDLKMLAHKLDVAATQVGRETSGSDLSPKRLKQRQVASAGEALLNHITAVEQVIMTGRAISLADATVQVMVASEIVGRIKTWDDELTKDLPDQVVAALESVLRVLAMGTRVGLPTIGGGFYASAWCEYWPAVDVSNVESDTDNDSIDRLELGT